MISKEGMNSLINSSKCEMSLIVSDKDQYKHHHHAAEQNEKGSY
jgi:hypothetical protein